MFIAGYGRLLGFIPPHELVTDIDLLFREGDDGV